MVRLRRPGRALPRDLDLRVQAARWALRYGENPHQQAALYVPVGPHAPRHRPGRAGPGQGAQLQQFQRRRRRARAGQRVPRCRADGRDRQARQSVRRRNCATPARRLERGPRLRQRLGLRRDRRRQSPARRSDRGGDHGDLHRSRRRARCGCGCARDLRAQEEPAPAADRRTARPGARRSDACGHHRRPSGAGSRQRRDHRGTSSNA